MPAPALSTSTIDGHKVALQDMRGKVVLVTFWATTCTICLAEQPDLVKTYERYRSRGIEIVAVAMPYDRPDLIKQHLAKYPMPFQVVWDKDGLIGRQFLGILGTPTTFIVDKSGRLVSKTVGAIDFDKLRHFLDASLG
ncbi:MAG: TlpA disulfide reductase family protein [Pseudomonadota bacterium]|nr:TlpA disulfide reductase family protein [Pseudomonadota bacterium]